MVERKGYLRMITLTTINRARKSSTDEGSSGIHTDVDTIKWRILWVYG
jgi:hypothetical protein